MIIFSESSKKCTNVEHKKTSTRNSSNAIISLRPALFRPSVC